MINRKRSPKELISIAVNADLTSAHCFLTMYNTAISLEYFGIANWIYAEYLERHARAMKTINFMHSRKVIIYIKGVQYMPNLITSIIHVLKFIAMSEMDNEDLMDITKTELIKTGDQEGIDFITALNDEQKIKLKKAEELFAELKGTSGNKVKLREIDERLKKIEYKKPVF